MRGIVIVGTGHTGSRAARTLRQEGWRGPVTLIGAELEIPYERPPLSKGILTGARSLEDCALFDKSFCERQGITLRIGARARTIDRGRQQIVLDDGTQLDYSRLLLATGAEPRQLHLPEAGAGAIRYLRSAADARSLAAFLETGMDMVIIGGGFIGLEVAASAIARGCGVTLIEAGRRLVIRSVPAEIERLLAERHRAAGVKFHLGRQVTSVLHDGAANIVRLDDGTKIAAQTILVAIGVTPRVDLAEAAGLAVDNGIAVDATLRTADPNIYAAGDACSFPHSLFATRIRLECWKGAEDQGSVAARNMLGAGEIYREIPWLWSDQYELAIQVAGLPGMGARGVSRPLAHNVLLVFHLADDGRIVGASGIGPDGAIGRDIRITQLMIEKRIRPDADALADPSVSLKTLLVAKAA